MGISKDYRNTDKCPILSEIDTKKNELELRIRERHKKVKILYNRINDKQGDYFKDFAKIYNFKCAYCGAALKFTDIRLFEIDHFICETAFPDNTAGRAEAGKIDNLTFSCFSCNRGKGKLHIKDSYLTLLNPDDNSIANIFDRDEWYYIKINDTYSKDSFLRSFYDKLLLGSEVRRLDFLLLEMENLKEQLQDRNKELAYKLEQCMSKLLQKKNYTYV